MKKTLLTFALGLMLSGSITAQTTELEWYLADNGNQILHPRPKSPLDLSFLPTVTFNDVTNVLTFEGNSDLGAVCYAVENDNQSVVASGTVNVYLNATSTINLGTLAAGSYTLFIWVGDALYAGEFEIIEQQ